MKRFLFWLCSKKKKYLLLSLLLIIGFFLRFWQLGVNPPGIHADEADSGYNAYSILKTGRDIYGNFLPVQIVGFAENYRAPLSTYITIPFVAIFGLSELTIRMQSAILGSLLPLLVYFLIKRLLNTDNVALIGAFLAAVNPWAVHISRAYADHILALDLGLIGIIFLLNKKKKLVYYVASGIFFGLALFSYHAPKIFLPLFIPLTLLFLGKSLLSVKKNIFLFLAVFLLFFIFMIKLSYFNKGAVEFNNVSIFNAEKAGKIIDKEKTLTTIPLGISGFFHNKLYFYAKEIGRNYGRSLSMNYLYLDGESNLTAWVGDRGLFFPVELPFFLIGIYFIFKNKRKLGLFLTGWILIGALPGGITVDQMYTYRNIYVLPVFIIITSFGLYSFFHSYKKRKVKVFLLTLTAILFFFSIISFYAHYFFEYPVFSRGWWAADQHEAINYALAEKDKFSQIYIRGGRDWPLLFAFYNKLDPSLFQKSFNNPVIASNGKYIKINKFNFGSFEFKEGSLPNEYFPRNSLYIGGPNDFPMLKSSKDIIAKDDWHVIYKIIEL